MHQQNKKRILIDVGSSTVKAYQKNLHGLKLIKQKTISFKNDFNPELGISETNKENLFEIINLVKEINKKTRIKIYATSIFRKLTKEARAYFIDEFFLKTGLFFNIISQDLENFYLQKALTGRCQLNEPVLLINIGGGSTELAVIRKKQTLERKNIDLGVGTVNGKFPGINEILSKVSLEKVVNSVSKILPELSNKCRMAFYSGGELTYMQRANYGLEGNKLFQDKDHPSVISLADFCQRNKKIFDKVGLNKLKALMPENPNWMLGARGCSAIAQAICQKYDIGTIIPSDSNLIHGASRQEFRNVTLSGSFRKHLKQILSIKKELEGQGVEILSPRFTKPRDPNAEFVVFAGEENLKPLELERYHLNSISNSDALIVCNPEGYVGASALIEIGFANMLGERIIFTEKPNEFMLNTLPAEIGL